MALHVATILGDLTDEIVIVGGLVPYLIVDQERAREPHVGTRDLDLGLSLAVLDHQRYREISKRLRDRGFEPSLNEKGNLRRQTWKLRDQAIQIDFLIPPVSADAVPGRLQDLEKDFAAIVNASLPLAFADALTIPLEGTTPAGERARRDVRVAGPAAFVALKAHSFRDRGANKDVYDLVYVLLNYGDVVADVAKRFELIADAPLANAALTILAQDFETADHVGAVRHAAFLGDADSADRRQDATGVVLEFLRLVRQVRP